MIYILRPRASVDPDLWEPRWDCAFGFIIQASSAKKARKIAAEGCGDEGENAWLSPDNSTCERLKITEGNGIIMRDFHAG